MSGLFCIHCGNRLEEDSSFCTACGKPVPNDEYFGCSPIQDDAFQRNPFPASAFAQTQRMEPRGFGAADARAGEDVRTQPFVAENPIATTPIKPVDPSEVAGKRPQKRPLSPLALGAVVFASAIIVFGGLAVLVIAHPWDSATDAGDAKTATVQQSPGGAGGSPGSSSEDSSSSGGKTSQGDAADAREAKGLTEAEAKAALSDLYSLLAGYDGDIRSCATDFNNTYVNADLTNRKASLSSCRDLKARIDASYAEAKALEVPSDSSYALTHQDICALYDDLSHRIGVIVEAWEIDVRYDDPAEHKTEIEEPIARDNVGGTNKYLSDYQERYEKANPQSV